MTHPISSKEQIFENIWYKMGVKSKDRLCQKMKVRGVEPTYEMCKSYWLGKIRPFKEPKTGKVVHIHNKEIRRRKRRYGRTARILENKNRRKNRSSHR